MEKTPSSGDLVIDFRVSITVAQIILEGLAKLPIYRAGEIYSSLRTTVDNALERKFAADRETKDAPPVTAEKSNDTH